MLRARWGCWGSSSSFWVHFQIYFFIITKIFILVFYYWTLFEYPLFRYPNTRHKIINRDYILTDIFKNNCNLNNGRIIRRRTLSVHKTRLKSSRKIKPRLYWTWLCSILKRITIRWVVRKWSSRRSWKIYLCQWGSLWGWF